MIEAVSGGAIPWQTSVVVMTALFLAYGAAGGLTAAIITDFIQGILTILVGVAVLSLASETAYRLLKRLLHRWPPVWTRIERFRERIHDWLHRGKSAP